MSVPRTPGSYRSEPTITGALSFRILTAFLLLLGVALAVVSAVVTMNLRSYLLDETDQSLRSSGQILATSLVDPSFSQLSHSVLPTNFYVYVAINGAEPYYYIYEGVEESYGSPLNPERLAATATSEPTTVEGTDPRSSWRVITAAITAGHGTPAVLGNVVIGLPMANVEEGVEELSHVLAVLVITVLGMGSLASYFIVRSSLSGLRKIRAATSQVSTGDLTARVPAMKDGSEVAILGEDINAMLNQIETFFRNQAASEARMRQFVSDASHELRTPLATIRGYAELYRMGGVPSDKVDHAFARVEAESGRMATLVEDLLELARLDERRSVTFKHVDLAATALNTVADFLARSPQRTAHVIDLDGGEVDSLIINGNQDQITQVLTNLLGNVAQHTPDNTPVEIAVGLNRDDPRLAIVEVRDHGPGIAEEDRKRVFERFYRTDSSRFRGSGGSGLGLAIVAAIMGTHQGSAAILETPGGGMTVRLTFPVCTAPHQVSEVKTSPEPKKRSLTAHLPLPRRGTGNVPKIKDAATQPSSEQKNTLPES